MNRADDYGPTTYRWQQEGKQYLRTSALDPGSILSDMVRRISAADTVRRHLRARDHPALTAWTSPKVELRKLAAPYRISSREAEFYHDETLADVAEAIRTSGSFFEHTLLAQSGRDELTARLACSGYSRVDPGDASVDFLASNQPPLPQALSSPNVRHLHQEARKRGNLGPQYVVETDMPDTFSRTPCRRRRR